MSEHPIEELKRRSLLLLDMIGDWVHHTGQPHYRIKGLTDGGKGGKGGKGGEEWRDEDFDEVLAFLEQLVGEH